MADALIPLRRNLRFQTFWTASVGATLGQAVGDIAYPLAIVTMTGSPGKAALFSALLVAGMLVAGLPAGSLADRYDSQRLALAACAIRTVTAVVVALALAGGWLTLPLLLVSAIVLGAGQALGSAANLLLLRSIVPGAPLVGFLHRLPPGVLLLAVCTTEVPVLALLAVPLGPWWAAGVLFVGLLGVPALRVLADILVVRQAPPERRGRVVAAFMTLIALGMPAGLGGAGLLLQYLPAQTAMLVLASAMTVVTGYGLSRPELRHAAWPSVAENPLPSPITGA
jgi:MFS family permease